jgi:hypothetical protein
MIKTHTTVEAFLRVSQSLLKEKEAANNLILGIAATLNRDINYYGTEPLSEHLS